MAWTDEPILALDFETTGLDVLEDRPVSIALVVADANGNQLAGSFHKIVNAGVPVPDEVSAIHGLTTQLVRDNGEEAGAVISEAVDVLNDHPRLPLLIYNAPFDYPLLLVEAQRYGLTIGHREILDPLVWSRTLFKYAPGGHTLSAVSERLGVSLDDAHDALADITAATDVGKAIAAQEARLTELPMGELQILQANRNSRKHDSTIKRIAELISGLKQGLQRVGSIESWNRVPGPYMPPTQRLLHPCIGATPVRGLLA